MKYVVGVDFGTLSARALIVEAESGKAVAESTSEYIHAVLDKRLPSGKLLKIGTALQVPSDYIKALSESVRAALEKSKINSEDVIGLGIDFTSSTVLSVFEDGTPLCESEKYKDEPHAYAKLWKHNTASKEAEDITRLAIERKEKFISIYGGKLSAELMLPKIFETLRCAPEVYNDTHRFLEAADWLSFILTGKETRSPAFAGYKAAWNNETGYPSNEFFAELDPRLDGIVGTKIFERVEPDISASAGTLNERGSEITGLPIGTALSLPMIDAHASLAGLGVTGDGEMVMIIGTSACYILNSTEKNDVKGIFGYVKDGVFPGLYTYESGQSAVGDMFDWFVKNSVPAHYAKEAEEKGIGVHALLTEKASMLEVGESGVVALDWWSGNRCILSDYSLRGMLYGITMRTVPEEIYRALLEAAVFGARVIFEQHEKFGINIKGVTAAGGIANKNPLLMQIYADVLNRDVRIAASTQSGALGSAAYAAAAAGVFPSIEAASRVYAPVAEKVYYPIPENVEKYNVLYAKYRKLHDYFAENKI